MACNAFTDAFTDALTDALTDADALTGAIDGLWESGPSAYADGESVEGLCVQLARLDAFVTAVVGAFDANGSWADDGAQTAASWLATRCREPRSQARKRVALARSLTGMPHAAQAWAEGEITGAHVGPLARAHEERTASAFERDEELLVDQARSLSFAAFSRALAYWEQLADPDGTEDRAEARRMRRDVFLHESFDGTWLGQMTLDPISGTIVSSELSRIERELFESDWKEAHEALGREPRSADLARTPSQRRADALVEMATRSRTAPVDGRRPEPLFSVMVGYETLHGRVCELAQGSVVSPVALLPWLDQACIERAVFSTKPRVEVSATARLFTGATRRGVELRDRMCAHPYCERPAPDCEVDHVVPYACGGPTTQENGRLL